MAYQRKFNHVKVGVSDGGHLLSDLPPTGIGAANYSSKVNWRREGFGESAQEVVREGWTYFSPNGSVADPNQYIVPGGNIIIAIEEVRRPNGTCVPVCVTDGGKVFWFNFDGPAWTQIGTGYSNPPSGRRWQIVNVGPYAVFNNGIDLPFTWLIGDASVTPIYELREQGVASVGSIWEYNQVLMLGDILEILTGSMSGIMNGGTPYAQITNPATTQRIQYRIQWSNVGDPRDHAATVNGSATSGSPTLTIAWPMASLAIGDEITVIGAGTSGGNLVTTISNIVGTTITMAANASTTIANTPVQKTSALNSIVGFYEFEDSGTAVIRGLALQNRVVIYKTSSIYVGYYTGDIDEPFVFERQYVGSRTPRFRWTLIDVAGRYHIYAGDEHFYRFKLGSQEPEIDSMMVNCEKSTFYSFVKAAAFYPESSVFACNNGATNEILFFILPAPPTIVNDPIIAYDYAHGCVSTLSSPDTGFSCGATIHIPQASKTANEREVAFVVGDNIGVVTQFGKTNLNLNTYSRYEFYTQVSTITTGLTDFSDSFNEKDVRAWSLLSRSLGAGFTFSLTSTIRDSNTAGTLETKAITVAGTIPLYYRSVYFGDSLTITPSITTSKTNIPRFHGKIWDFAMVDSMGTRRGSV